MPLVCHGTYSCSLLFPIARLLIVTLTPKSLPSSESGIPHIKTANYNRFLFSLLMFGANMLSQCNALHSVRVVETIHFFTNRLSNFNPCCSQRSSAFTRHCDTIKFDTAF